MKVFIKAFCGEFPETETEYTAWQGFRELGYDPVFFQTEEELQGWRPDHLIVGGISLIKSKLTEWGIEVPEYDYPAELEEFLGRKIWTDTLDSVLSNKEKWPVFVKPVKDKVFVGFLLSSERDIPRLREAKPDEPVLCSEPVTFLSEWRAFVRYGRIWDVRPYRGDWRYPYDPEVLEKAVNAYRSSPAGYAMDFGVTENGRTLLVEVNDGFALGCYGADPIQYAKLLSARWCELTGIRDECDVYFEGADWKERGSSSRRIFFQDTAK